MADQKISQLSAASTLTGSELVPIVQSAATVASTPNDIKNYTLADLQTTYGLTGNSRNVPDMTATTANVSQIGRMLTTATGGNGFLSGFVALPIDGTPTIAYLAATSGRFWVGYKNSTNGTPTWREFAPLDTPTFTTRIGVGTGSNTNAAVYVNPSLTGTVGTNMDVRGTIATDFTSNAYGVTVTPTTAAGSQTIASVRPFTASMGAITGTTTVTNVYGYIADSSLGTQAAIGSAFGYYSTIVAGTNRWQLYMQGTANSYFGGPVGMGTTSIGGTTGFTGLRVDRNITGALAGNITHVRSAGTIQSDVTGTATMIDTSAATQATSFTMTLLNHFRALQGTIGAGSAITTQTGFLADATLIGASFNLGFRGQIPSGTDRFNLYMDGTAKNYIRGDVGIGSGKTSPTCALDVNGQVAQSAANTLTAAGTNLGTALALTAAYNVVTSAAAGTGVSLPNVIGAPVWVFNNQGTNAISVYPPNASGTINGGGAGSAVSLAANGKMQYVQVATNVWYTMS